MTPVTITRGTGPIVLGQPHCGTHVPEQIVRKLNDTGRTLVDTDWHVDRLYEGLLEDVTIVRANFHRYVIDPNRDPTGESLYPGQNTTGLVPLTTFDDQFIWLEEPDELEIEERLGRYHRAYHTALNAELDRVAAIHGGAVLYDCHSIRSKVPFLFEGTLPVLNIGTNSGRSCAREIERAAEIACADHGGFDFVVNGRFRGGWTTRYYGRPDANIHAIQMELAQSAYLKSETLPFEYDAARAEKLRVLLKHILSDIKDAFIHLP